jgi:SNW domain-containing protein 1
MAFLYLPAPARSGSKVGPAPGGSRSAIVSSSEAEKTTQNTANGKGSQKRRVPSYDDRVNSAIRFSKLTPEERKQPENKKLLFVPRSAADFDDGGSFPEIQVAQYPRHMGNPHLAKRNNASSAVGGGGASNNNSSAPSSRAIITRDVLSAQVDATGKVSYDAIVTGGTNADKKVYSKHSDLRGCRPSGEEIALPSQDEETSTAERTQRALAALISTKVAMDKPTGSAIAAATDSATAHDRTQFIRYTPNENAPGYNPQASQRIIRMVPKQIDPMQPPKHMHRKAPGGPAEDPVPVLHAPPEKLSKEEREAWNVPACISNWKNTRGYTIPLDKRLAADGRGLRDDATINPNFAVLSESLYVAERQAREEVRTRAAVQKRLVLDQRQRREDELRELANKARMERSQVGGNSTAVAAGGTWSGDISGQGGGSYHVADENDDDSVESMTQQRNEPSSPPVSKVSNVEEEQARLQRDRLRSERRREREKEYRLERAGKTVEDDNTEEELKKKRRLENDRDVSEKIALGTHTGSGGAGGVDSRLYSQNAGLDSGFGAADEYNTYSRPMFDREGVASSSIYRPTRDANMEDADAQYDKLKRGSTSKFAPDKGFGGAEGGGATAGGASRSAPVQFEKGNN